MESQRQKIVNLVFVVLAALMSYVVYRLAGRITAYFDLEARVRNLDLALSVGSVVLGVICFAILYRRDDTNQFANEAVAELERVSWPVPKDTAKATGVVLIMVLISGVILGGLDSLWAWLIRFIL